MLPLLLVLAAAVLRCAALPPITVKGSFLFDSSTGDRFYVKGVAYAANYGSSQTGGVESSGTISALDPLANPAGCQRDIPYFQQLGINIIRVYQVNASLDHSECMQALNSAGIYVALDLATPSANDAINTVSPSWNVGLLTNFITTIEAFGSFQNVFGFNIGNEVISSLQDDDAAPYIKAGIRDIKAYLKAHNYTQLVGYTATDSPNSRVALPYYLACNATSGSTLDYWGLNIYEWCGQSSFTASGYQARTEELASLGVPAFFSEYGCNAVTPRTFQDVPTLYSTQMTGVWSGGIIYEYQEQSNNYGLVTISADGSSVTPTADFNNLKTVYSQISPANQSMSSYTPTISEPVSCPASNSSWPVSGNVPPTPNNDVCTCVVNNLSCTSSVAASGDLTTIGTAIGTVCGESAAACAAISGNGTTGVYGSLSFCDPGQQLNIALDAYYEAQNRAATACNFNGVASVNSAGKPTDTAAVASATSKCIQQGFASGTGVPSPTSVPAGATTQPLVSPTGSGSSGSGKNAASALKAEMAGVLVSVVAAAIGAAMVL